MTPGFDTPAETALAAHRQGLGAVLVTVVETWSSAPRPVGTLLTVDGTGAVFGAITGGCIEPEVAEAALACLAVGRSEMRDFAVTDGQARAAGLACGGAIRVMLQPVGASGLTEALLADLVAAHRARRAVALITDTGTWQARLAAASSGASDEDLRRRFISGKPGFDGTRFVALNVPRLRLVIVGAVRIAKTLASMASMAGFEIHIVDPRALGEAPVPFPDHRIATGAVDLALSDIGLDPHTAVVTLTHDPMIDDPAIEAALAADVVYIGALGSRQSHARRLGRLRERGTHSADLGRISGPVGLDIRAQSSEEIAVSILAELIAVLRQSPLAVAKEVEAATPI
ncbi:MAG: XdhC family protein [Pseudomonadota bacterium]